MAEEQALAEAARVDAAVAAGESLPSPLAGVPLALKDVFTTTDMPTTCGSKILQGWTSLYDATVTARLRAAGIPILGKTNMDDSRWVRPPKTPHRVRPAIRGTSTRCRADWARSAAALDTFQRRWPSDRTRSGRSAARRSTATVGVKPTYGTGVAGTVSDDTVPYVGFTPTVAGQRGGLAIDPPVSDPMASGAWNAASAAALPPPDPPGTRSTSHGLRVGPYAEFSVDEPIANSSMFVLPRIGMPAARSRAVTVASYGDVQPSRIFDPQVVGMSVVVNTSLSASGTPASGDGSSSPAATAASTRAAVASACSSATCRNAWYSSSVSAIRSRHARVDLRRRHLLGGDLGAQRRRVEPDHSAAHSASPRMRGTANRPSTALGACAAPPPASGTARRRRAGTR